MRNKYKGVTLSATAIAIIAWMFLGYISFIVMASPFSILASARTARQAEQYAEFVASSLKLVDYSELSTASHARQSLTGEIAGAVGWESRVEIGAEQRIGSNPDNLQRIATIDIFQTGDTLSRYTLQVPLSSAGGSSNKGLGFPDYENGIYLPYPTRYVEQSYIMPDNGWFSYTMCGAGITTAAYIKINDKYVYRNVWGDSDAGGSWFGIIPVLKNDVVSVFSLCYGTDFSTAICTHFYFYPIKK